MKTNKLLSVVLTLCVLLAAFSLTAFAADGETHSIAVAYCVEGDENGVVEEYAAEDLQNAINEIAETAAMFEATAVKMTLQADVTGVASTLKVPAGTEFTLDLAGHTLEGNNQGNDQAFLLVNGKLTLTDSVGTGKICSTYTGRSGHVVSVAGGELTVAGGTITTKGMAQAGNAIYVSKGSTLSMTGGKVYADAKRGNYAIRIGGRDAVFTMTGGVAEADSSTTETYITAIGVSSTGTVTIGGDSVVRGPEALTTTSMTALTVTGGSFTGEVSAPKNSISGGSFTKAVQPEYCAEGFVPAANADGTYGVKVAPVAKIGTVEYATLNEAFAAAKDGDTITIARNFTTDETKTTAADRATVTANVTLDFGSYVMTVPASLEPTANFMAILVDGSTLTVEGTTGGIVSGDAEICGVYGFNVKGGGKLVINGGSYYCGITVAQAQLGTIEVNGGNFAVNDANGKYPGYMFNCVDANYAAGTAGITVSGGTFAGYDPRNNTAEGKGTSFVAEGVGVDAADGSFTAVPNMAAQIVDADGNSVAAYTGHYDAIAAAKDGEKVILLSDRKNFVTNTINANITIDLNGKTLSVGNNNPFFRTNGEVTIQNGTIDSQYACVIVNAYNKLTLKNVKITGVTGNNGMNLVNVYSNAEVTIDKDTVLTASGSNGAAVFIGQDADAKYTLNVYGKVIRESKSFAISGNGSYKGTTTINIYDGAEVKSASVAIYHPQAGVINVNGGLVEGYCAIGIKSGTLNINGGTVRGTADDHVLDDSNSTSGTIIYDGSAIVVDSRAAGYAGNVNINVTGGTVESCYSTAIREIGEQDKPNMTQLTKLNITGGSVLGASQQLGNVTNDMLVRDISSSNVSVSGGTFNHAVPETYCADGFVPTKNEDGTYGVKESLYVAEVNGVKFATLAEAIKAAAKGSTVTLLADTRENVTIDKALTLDLNGFTLNGGTVKAKPALTITARIVTIKDSSAAQTGTIMREDTAENSGVSSHYVIDIQGNAWVMFESGKVTNNSGSAAGKGAYLVRIGDDSVAKQPGLVIKGGTFTQDNFVVIKVDRGYLTLKGGTLNSTDSYAIENWYSATIKGGTVNGTVAAWTYSDGSNSTLTVEDGTINGNVLSVNYGSAESKVAKVEITGGTVNGALGTYIYSNGLTATEDTSKATIGITGGTFTDDPTKYVTEDSAITANADGTFGVAKAYLAKVGNTSYYTMDEAFKAQTTSGEPVVLLRDYTTGGTFNSGSINRTVDLNGHTWTYTGTNADDAAFKINYPDVTLTVKNGTVVSGSMVGLIPSAMGGTIKYDNSGLVLDGVTATANGNSGIETNGNNTNDTVTLKNSTLNVPNGFGIYFPSSGTLTLDNSTVTAKTMGVQVCAGSLSINEGSAVTVTGDAVPKAENDGAIQDGAAISVVNRIGYKGLGTVTVSGGKFTAKEGNSAIKAYNWANATETAFTENDKVAVSGGTFSSEIKSEYCAEGFVPVRNTDGTYTVAEKAENPFGKTKLLVNRPVMQWKNKDNYSIVIYTGIDSLNYQKAGFVYRIAATLKDGRNVDSGNREMKTTVAYKTIKGTNNKNMPYTYTAKEDFGSEYIYALTFMFPVDRFTSANTTLYVTPFVDTLDGDRVYGKEIVLTEAALSAKGSHLFYNGQ